MLDQFLPESGRPAASRHAEFLLLKLCVLRKVYAYVRVLTIADIESERQFEVRLRSFGDR